MGKDLKGRGLGTGISQRDDGLYVGRFTNKYGKRVQKVMPKLKDVRQWLGHSNIRITMNLYVHTTEEQMQKEIDLVADALKVI